MTTDHDDPRARWRAVVSRPLGLPPFRPMSSAFGLEVAAVSRGATPQSQNTDHYLAIRLGRLQETLTTSVPVADLPPRFEEYAYAMLVADGLGANGAGARASRLALSALAHLAIRYGQWNVRVGADTATDIIEQGEFFYRQVNDAITEARRTDVTLADMATSLTAAYVAGVDLFFAHAGHSKAFIFRDGVLISLTTNHPLPRLVTAPSTLRRDRSETREPLMSKPEAPSTAPAESAAIGERSDGPDVAIEHVQLWSGDRVLMCTDGLTAVVQEGQIAELLAAQRRPAEDCQRLVDFAVSSGAADSVTVLIADYRIRPTQTPPELRAR